MAGNLFGASAAAHYGATPHSGPGTPGPTVPPHSQELHQQQQQYLPLRRDDLRGLSLGGFPTRTGGAGSGGHQSGGGAIIKRQRGKPSGRTAARAMTALDGNANTNSSGLASSMSTDFGQGFQGHTGVVGGAPKGAGSSLLQQLQATGTGAGPGASPSYGRTVSIGAVDYRGGASTVYEADGIQFKLLEDLADSKVKRLKSEKIKPIEELTFEDIKAYNRNQLRAYCFVYGIKRKKKADMEANMARYAAMFHPADPQFDTAAFVPTDYVEGPIPRRRVPVTKEQKNKSAGKFAARFLPTQRARGPQRYPDAQPHYHSPNHLSGPGGHQQQPHYSSVHHAVAPAPVQVAHAVHGQQHHLGPSQQHHYTAQDFPPRGSNGGYVRLSQQQQQQHQQQQLHQQHPQPMQHQPHDPQSSHGYLSSFQSGVGVGSVPHHLLSDIGDE